MKWTRLGRYIATTFRHVIPQVSKGDEGAYYCEADNKLGQTGKAMLNMKVLYGPQVVVKKHEEVDEGASLSVKCEAIANPRPTSFEWIRADNQTFKSFGQVLTLKTISNEQSGDYTCIVKNILKLSDGSKRERFGNATIKVYVRHRPGPSAISPADPLGIAGKRVSLSCDPHPMGYPKPQYRWYKSDNPSATLATSRELTITQVTIKNEGQYNCIASNGLGEGAPGHSYLKVIY